MRGGARTMIKGKHFINSQTSDKNAHEAASKNLKTSKWKNTGFVSYQKNCPNNPEEDCSPPYYAAYYNNELGGSRRGRKMHGGGGRVAATDALYKYTNTNAASEAAAIKLAQARVQKEGGPSKAYFSTVQACNVGVPTDECEQYGKQVFTLKGGKRKTGRRNRRN